MMIVKCDEYSCCEKITVMCEHWYYGTRNYEYYIEYYGDEELEEILRKIKKQLDFWGEGITFRFQYVIEGNVYTVDKQVD